MDDAAVAAESCMIDSGFMLPFTRELLPPDDSVEKLPGARTPSMPNPII